MALAGVKVLLDIQQLSVGVDIEEFMKDGVNKSDSIFWIGTPRLVERIKFNNDIPANPATFEYRLICDKIKEAPHSLYPLLFSGDNPKKSFPPLYGSAVSSLAVLDFRKERNYFKIMPQLAAAVLGVEEWPEYQHMFNEYCTQIREIEAKFTTASILKRMETAEMEMQQQAAKAAEQLKQLLEKIPGSLLLELEGTKEAQLRAFHSRLEQVRTRILTKSTAEMKGLDLYIPLKSGTQLDTPTAMYFDIEKR
jgi:hypothetical protein